MTNNWRIGVVGLGYVGLPLAVQLSRHYSVVGFNRSLERVESLRRRHDPNEEVSDNELASAKIEYTCEPADLKQCNFIIVAVPTPIDQNNKPDLELVRNASELVGKNMSKGAIVVYESTVYPGVTEDICQQIIEKFSGLKCGTDWKIGYSPERVNPGDKKHTIDKIVKVVSGMDKETCDAVAEVYGSFTKVHKASNIKTAEAAKVIENIQRDLNIALMNELSLIFEKLGIKTRDVIEAAATKWNFHSYWPGLVGGHCIGVDPYYLTYRAQELGYNPEVILAGRSINDRMPKIVAQKVIKTCQVKGIQSPKVYVMGLTFKENVKDFRNSKAKAVIEELRTNKAEVIGWDPLLDDAVVEREFGIKNIVFDQLDHADAIMVLAPHDEFKGLSAKQVAEKTTNGVLFDLRGIYDERALTDKGITYLTL